MLCCAFINFSCMHQCVPQRVFLVTGLDVKRGGVRFPFVYQNVDIGAGCWLTCVQRPVCSSGLRTKLKIHCSTTETQWHWVEDWIIRRTEKLKVTVLPRWCTCTLNKGRMFRKAPVSQPHRLVVGECIAVCWHGCSLWRPLKAQICDCHISQESQINLV